MKKIILSIFTVALLASCGGDVVTKTENFKVYGNCGMCEKTIEGSLKNVEGVVIGDWNKDTKQMAVEFDESKIKLGDIKAKIAGVGYDMDDVRSDEEVYAALPGCCQYTRAGQEANTTQTVEEDSTEVEENLEEEHNHDGHDHTH